MKALLIQPPIEDFYLTPHRLAALGLRSLVPLLEAAGWNWELLNYPLGSPNGKSKPLPSELSYLEPHLVQGEGGPISWFRGWKRYGPQPHEIAHEAAAVAPDIILLSCFAWAYAEEALDLIEPLKAACPDAFIVAGGGGVTVMPGVFLEKGADLVIRGEGEASLPALLDAIAGRRPLRSVPNILLPADPVSLEQPEPPTGPLMPVIGEIMTAGKGGGKRIRRFSASMTRGCPRGCRFCSNSLCHGSAFRSAVAQEVLTMLKAQLEREGGPQLERWHVNFEDDNILFDRRGFFEVLDLFRNLGGAFSFSAENGLDYSMLTPDVIRNLKFRGLTQLNLSLAAADPARAEEQNRFLKPHLYRRAVAMAGEFDLPVITYFIAGLPGDTPTSIVKTLAGLTEVPTRTGISIFYPVPGLDGLPNPEYFASVSPRLCAGSAAWPWGGGLSTVQLITAFRLARFSNLLRDVLQQGASPKPGVVELKDRIMETRRLHTLVRENRTWRIVPVPVQDREMVVAYCGMTENKPR